MSLSKKLNIALFAFSFLVPTLSFAHGPCKADREKFCPNVQPGEGRIRNCMKEHYNQLSAECRQKIEERKAKHSQETSNPNK